VLRPPRLPSVDGLTQSFTYLATRLPINPIQGDNNSTEDKKILHEFRLNYVEHVLQKGITTTRGMSKLLNDMLKQQ
jgi:hypothetical protein